MTAEVAITFPVIVLALAVVLLAGSLAQAGVACVDGARVAARAISRGDTQDTAVAQARAVAGDAATIQVVAGPTEGLMTVQVVVGAVPRLTPSWVDPQSWRLPVACQASAWAEPTS